MTHVDMSARLRPEHRGPAATATAEVCRKRLNAVQDLRRKRFPCEMKGDVGPSELAPLSQTASLALPLKEAEDVTLANGALHVADDGASRVIQELHAYLSSKKRR